MVVFDVPTFITTERISELFEKETENRAGAGGPFIKGFTENTTMMDRGMIIEFHREDVGKMMINVGEFVLRADSGAEMRMQVAGYNGKKCFCCAMK